MAAVLVLMLAYTVVELNRLDLSLGTTTTKEIEAALATARWWLWGRLALLSFGLLATILYYIRWQNGCPP